MESAGVTIIDNSLPRFKSLGDEERKETDEIFEPYDYGNNTNPISFLGAVIHVLKFTIGYGILIMPYIYKSLGYVIASVLTLFTAILYYHIIHIMIDVEYQLCKIIRKPKLTFLEVIHEGFSRVSLPLRIIFGSVAKVLTHVCFFIPTGNTISLILMANMLMSMLEYWGFEIGFLTALTIIFVPSMLLSVLVLQLNFMVPLSALTNVFTVIIIGIVIGFPFFSEGPRHPAQPFKGITLLPQCFSLLVDTFDATSVILPVKNEMRTPQQFSSVLGVLNVTGLISFLVFASFGFIGYWNYGEETKADVLDNIPSKNILSFFVNALFLPGIAVHNYLSTYVRCDIYRKSVLEILGIEGNPAKTLMAEYSLRIFFNIIPYVLAVSVPSFSIFTTITGTIGILIDIAIMPLLQFCLMLTFWPGCKFRILIQGGKNAVIICIAFVLFLGSAYACIQDLLKLYRNEL